MKVVFIEFSDLAMTYLPTDKVEIVKSIGKIKASTQKNRAKEGIRTLSMAQRATFAVGCYEQLKFDLLKQLSRIISESNPADFESCKRDLSACIESEKQRISDWIENEYNKEEF
jgi:hypothetical protein